MTKAILSVHDGSFQELPEAHSQTHFNIQQGEKLLWLEGATYHSYVTDTQIIGTGVSKGNFEFGGASVVISDNISVFGGAGTTHSVLTTHEQVVNTEYLRHLASGVIGVTDRSIYFRDYQNRHTFRHSHEQIVSIDYGRDGMTIVPDTENALPKVFMNCQGSFLYHLIQAIWASPSPIIHSP